jgi:hypothetical protein
MIPRLPVLCHFAALVASVEVLSISSFAASGACPRGRTELGRDEPPSDEGSQPTLTVPWVAAQLLPSPELVIDEGQAKFGARWQLTPVLYSFGIHRRLSPWRTFIVEPIVRHSGSSELYVSPEYLALSPRFVDRLGTRIGIRSTFPVLHRGEYLSVSIGTSMLHLAGHSSVAYELGSHVLFGFLGVLATYSPTPEGHRWIFTLDVRVF